MGKQQSINRARKAVEDGKVNYIRFYRDGSGFEIEFTDPTGDHGMPCLINSSFSMEDAPAILAGWKRRVSLTPSGTRNLTPRS